MHKWFDRSAIFLIVVAIVGSVFAVKSAFERVTLESEVARLEDKIGHLDVKDPGRVYVTALKTAGPFDFAWRIYLPANFKMNLCQSFNGGSTTFFLNESSSSEFIARIKVGPETGEISAVSKIGTRGGKLTGQAHRDLLKAVETRDATGIVIYQAGKDGVATFETTEDFELLKIEVPLVAVEVSDNQAHSFVVKFVKPGP